MDFRQIEYFIQLFKLRNMTKASRELFISQQGLSRSIKNLEDELGISLFEKSQRGAFPTPAGEALKPYFESLLQDRALLLSKAEKLQIEQEQQSIRIVSGFGSMYTEIISLLKSFEDIYPETALQISVMSEEEMLSALNAGLCSFAFIQAPLPSGLTSYGTVLKENFAAVMAPTHPLGDQKKFHWTDVDRKRIAMGDPSSANTKKMQFLLERYRVIPEKIEMPIDIIARIPELLTRQIICILPPSVMGCFNPAHYTALPIEPDFTCCIHCSAREDHPLNPTEKKFVEFIQNKTNIMDIEI